MICVECCNVVPSLYTRFTNNGHLKLSYCAHCNAVCDKYVEFDLVIFFIDILLLKPQAYRHLVFNSLLKEENEPDRQRKISFADTDKAQASKLQYYQCSLKDKLKRITQPARVAVSFILFEVYLDWAYEELKQENTILFGIVLKESTFVQYIVFVLQCGIEFFMAHLITQISIFLMYRNSERKKKYPVLFTAEAISTTVLIAGGTKLYPILMLIWPYDSQISTTLINHYYTNLTMIEALRITIGIRFYESLFIVILSAVCKKITSAVLITICCKYLFISDSLAQYTVSQLCQSELDSAINGIYQSLVSMHDIFWALFN